MIGVIIVNKKKLIPFILILVLLSTSLTSGCSAVQNLSNTTPAVYTEGINYSKEYEDNILEVYDDAIVYDEFIAFNEAIIFCGSEDDFDDILDFYKDFFSDNEIVLNNEVEDRDEYYASGHYDGYAFKIKITEPDGEYIEDLFENIITLSTRELDDSDNIKATLEPSATPSPTKDITQNTNEPVEEIQRPDIDKVETRLTSLKNGAWSFSEYIEYDSWDWTIYINSPSTGSMYYTDYTTGERWWDEFTYTIEDGILTITFLNEDTFEYFAYYEYDLLSLVAIDNFDSEFSLMYFGESSQESSFDAYGDWVVYYAGSDFTGTISFWQNGTGYLYNGYENKLDIFFTWENIDGVIYYWDEAGSELGSFSYIRRHNILEYYDDLEEYDPYFYNRTDRNLLIGTYEQTYTNDDDISYWAITLNDDHSAFIDIDSIEGNYNDDSSYWYVDNDDGMLYIYIGDGYYGFYYHHFESGLVLVEPEADEYYEFTLLY